MSKGRRSWMSQLISEDRGCALPPPFCSVQTLNRLEDSHLRATRAQFFPQSSDSNANPFQKHSHRYTQKYCFTSY